MSSVSQEHLFDVSKKLLHFLSGSEKVFLGTGNRLQSLADRATTIINSSGSATNLGSAESATSPVQSLAEVLRSMEQHLSACRRVATAGTAGLTRILEKVEGLADAGAEFQRIATMLRALATSLRVEDGRCAQGFGFDSVSADVVRLGCLIATKFDGIMSQASDLNETARAARKRERDFLDRQGACASGLLDEARSGLTQMAQLETAGATIRNQGVQASGDINNNVARVLVALQVHDITRQMIEHVIESLQDYATEMADKKPSPAAGSSKPEQLADLSTLCRIQSLQVGKAREELVAAHVGIAKTLRAISAQVATIVEETRHLTANGDGSSFLADVERGVGQAANTIHQQLLHEKQTFAAVESVASATVAMEGFVSEIAIIANDVKVVALNALVKAVKTGSNGAVFAILAQAIKDLSIEVAGKTELAGQTMREMAQLATGLGQREQRDGDSDKVEDLLTHLMADLRLYHTSLLASLKTVRQESTAIAAEVEEIARALAQQAQTTQALKLIEQDLAALGAQAAAMAGPLAHDKRSRWADEASDRYTMESERIIHHTATSLQAMPDVEPSAPPAKGSEMGDNVELF